MAHGPAFASAGLVHGYGVAFGVGAAFLLLAAVVSAVFVTGRGSAVAMPGAELAVDPLPS